MVARNYIAYESGEFVRRPSQLEAINFLSVIIGASNLAITESAGHFDFAAKKLQNIAVATAAADATSLSQVQALIAASQASFEWQASVLTRGFTPPTVPVEGGRYLISGGVPTGVWAGQAEKIATYASAAYTFVTPTIGTFVSVDAEDTGLYSFGGSVWGFKQFEATTASLGLEKVGVDVRVKLEATNPTLAVDGSAALGVKLDAAGGIQSGAAGVNVKLDGATLAKAAAGLKIAAAGVTEVELAASVAGAGLVGGVGVPLAVGAGDAIKVLADAIAVDYARNFTNDNAGAVTVGQVVYQKPNGNIDLATATNASSATDIGIVEAASIATAAAGKVVVRPGAIVGGFSALTIGALVYVSKATAGGTIQNLSAFVTGDNVYAIGRAISATEIKYNPRHIIVM